MAKAAVRDRRPLEPVAFSDLGPRESHFQWGIFQLKLDEVFSEPGRGGAHVFKVAAPSFASDCLPIPSRRLSERSQTVIVGTI